MVITSLQKKLDRIIITLQQSGAKDSLARVELVCLLIFLKILDEEKAQSKRVLTDKTGTNRSDPILPIQTDRFSWSSWKDKNGSALWNFVNDSVLPYLASLGDDELIVADFFHDAELRTGTPETLGQLIAEIDELNFVEIEPSAKGQIIGYLVENLQPATKGVEYCTPNHICQLLVAMVSPSRGEKIFDPACGLGDLLVGAVSHLLEENSEEASEIENYCDDQFIGQHRPLFAQNKKGAKNLRSSDKERVANYSDTYPIEEEVYGLSASRQLLRISITNLLLQGLQHPRIKIKNLIAEPISSIIDSQGLYYDVIVSNPFPQLRVSMRRSEHRFRNWDSLFLSRIMELLAPGGRCALVFPKRPLTSSRRDCIDVRKKLIEEFSLLAIIQLPRTLFAPIYSRLDQFSIVVFRKPSPAEGLQQFNRVWFYELQNDWTYNSEFQAESQAPQNFESGLSVLLSYWKKFKDSNFTEPPGLEANSVLEAHSQEPLCWWVDKDTLAENSYSLDGQEYKPVIAKSLPSESPVELIKQVIEIEKSLAIELEKLCKEMDK